MSNKCRNNVLFFISRYLYNETVNLQSVMTALTTLYAAHKYMCPGLAKIVVKYLKENLSEKNVLFVLQHICLYCASATSSSSSAAAAGGGGAGASSSSTSSSSAATTQQELLATYWDVPITSSPRASKKRYADVKTTLFGFSSRYSRPLYYLVHRFAYMKLTIYIHATFRLLFSYLYNRYARYNYANARRIIRYKNQIAIDC